MVYIIGIIVAIIIISLIKDFVVEHWRGLLLIVAVILAFVFTGPAGGIGLILLIAFIYWIREQIKKSNEKKLLRFLNQNSTKMGLVSSYDFDRMAPGFRDKKYKTSFHSIMQNFVVQNENKYILNNPNIIVPAVSYIESHVMADMQELVVLNYPELSFTHFKPSAEIIADFLQPRCGVNAEFSNIKLQEDKIKEELKAKNIPYSSAFLNAYKLNSAGLLTTDSFESEEISIDDL